MHPTDGGNVGGTGTRRSVVGRKKEQPGNNNAAVSTIWDTSETGKQSRDVTVRKQKEEGRQGEERLITASACNESACQSNGNEKYLIEQSRMRHRER